MLELKQPGLQHKTLQLFVRQANCLIIIITCNNLMGGLAANRIAYPMIVFFFIERDIL